MLPKLGTADVGGVGVSSSRGPMPIDMRLKSANPAYVDYTCLAEEAHIVGKMLLWTARKV